MTEIAVKGHSIPHELQTILGNLSEQSHRSRKKYNSYSLKNIKILIPTPTFLQCVHTFDVSLRQHSFNLQQLVWKICSNYFKFAATLFNMQQLHLICTKVFFLFAATFNLQHAPCGPPYVSYTVWHEMFIGSNFRKFRGLFVDLRKLNPVKNKLFYFGFMLSLSVFPFILQLSL